MADAAVRTSVLANKQGGSASVRLTAAAPNATRVALRAPAESLSAISSALGVTVPDAPKTSGRKGGATRSGSGHDEWLVIDESGADLMAALKDPWASRIPRPTSRTATSRSCLSGRHRDRRSSQAARRTLARSLPRRRLLAHAVRQGRDRALPHRGYVPGGMWRSFADFVFGLLAEGAEDAGH